MINQPKEEFAPQISSIGLEGEMVEQMLWAVLPYPCTRMALNSSCLFHWEIDPGNQTCRLKSGKKENG